MASPPKNPNKSSVSVVPEAHVILSDNALKIRVPSPLVWR
jgi:hypothetical protein